MKFWDEKEPLARCSNVRESKSASAALWDYAQMGASGGERSLRKLVERYKAARLSADSGQTTPPPSDKWSTITGWSIRYKWVERVNDWDNLQRMDLLRRAEVAQKEMLDKHIRIAQNLQKVALQKLQSIQEQKGAELSPNDLKNFLQLAINIERMSIGLPSEILEFQRLTDDELTAKYKELLARIGGPGSSNENEGADPSRS